MRGARADCDVHSERAAPPQLTNVRAALRECSFRVRNTSADLSLDGTTARLERCDFDAPNRSALRGRVLARDSTVYADVALDVQSSDGSVALPLREAGATWPSANDEALRRIARVRSLLLPASAMWYKVATVG